MSKAFRPEKFTGSPARRRSLLLSGIAVLTDVVILGAGAAGMKLGTCGVRLIAFYPVVTAALLALAAAILATAWGFRSLRSPGGAARSAAPLLALCAWALAVLTLFDVLSQPDCMVVK